MQNNFKLKLSIFIGLLVIIIGILYLSYLGRKPKEVFTPTNYPTGSTISIYSKIPPMFPAGVILENTELKNSSVLSLPDGKIQVSLSYISEQKIPDLVNLYTSTLSKSGWSVSVADLRHSNYVLTASKAGDTVIITMSLTRELQPLLSFQYEK